MTEKIQTWVVTGYSHKMDGLLLVVNAASAEGAVRKVGQTINARYVNIDGVLVLANKDMKTEEIKECLDEPSWFWTMYTQAVDLDKNLSEAVCW